ncbi:unnamed protein product, partial [marine sediment metagenome]
RDDLAANDYNLNIRRYADNSPPPEPHDVRAHLVGGVPKREVEAQGDLFAAHGFDPGAVFVNGSKHYYKFAAKLKDRGQIKGTIENDAGVKAREAELAEKFCRWWKRQQKRLVELPERKDVRAVRAELLQSFERALVPVGLLDRFKVAGVVASWWYAAQYDLKTLSVQGFDGLVDGWVATIRDAIGDGSLWPRQTSAVLSGDRVDHATDRSAGGTAVGPDANAAVQTGPSGPGRVRLRSRDQDRRGTALRHRQHGLRADESDCDHEPAIRELDGGPRERAADRGHAGSAHAPLPHPGDTRRKLPTPRAEAASWQEGRRRHSARPTPTPPATRS